MSFKKIADTSFNIRQKLDLFVLNGMQTLIKLKYFVPLDLKHDKVALLTRIHSEVWNKKSYSSVEPNICKIK